MNLNAFPNSWNANDSLVETYLANGYVLLGKENYRQSLKLHPGNGYAIKALKE